mmetsp:Transcript_24077/g.71595  ORF Transcript_24077/g.71595 Transcript_24077/m.71595 type:complete len:605 (-) Transcript_24077:81-1895(-)
MRKYLQEREVLMLGGKLDLVVGTPGRLNDMLRDQTIRTKNVRHLVLDEADRMLDMGFEPQLREIVDHLPADGGRQTFMFSATWPSEVRKLAMDFLDDPVRINVGGEDELVAAKSIVQQVRLCDARGAKLIDSSDLIEKMEAAMKEEGHGNARSSRACHTIVFVNRKRDAEMVAEYIERNVEGVRAESLHGDLLQGRRDRVRDNVKSGRAQVLVATDVAARGLDVRTIRQVINYDMPNNMEDYIHRIGRTGRAGAKGEAHTFMDGQKDGKYARALCEIMVKAEQAIPGPIAQMAGLRSGTYRPYDDRSALQPHPSGGMMTAQAAQMAATIPQAVNKPDECGDFKRGNCQRGARCKYSHGGQGGGGGGFGGFPGGFPGGFGGGGFAGGFGGGGVDMQDLFQQLFRRQQMRVVQVELSLEELYSGATKTYAFSDPRTGERREVRVRIQPGMEPGTRLPVPGTNMVFQLAERRHARFERHGDNLHMPLSLSLYEALTGFQRPIKHLDGRRLWVSAEREATRPGVVRRLRGAGMPRFQAAGKGDLLVHFDVRFPSSPLRGSAAATLKTLLKGSAGTASPVPPAGERTHALELLATREEERQGGGGDDFF